MTINESTSTVDIYIASAQTQGEKVLAAEVVRLRAALDNARFAAENYRERYMSANDDPTCPALAWMEARLNA